MDERWSDVLWVNCRVHRNAGTLSGDVGHSKARIELWTCGMNSSSVIDAGSDLGSGRWTVTSVRDSRE
jgi:hypothetical protein